MFFKRKKKQHSYDSGRKKPVIRASICNGEQVAGFMDLRTGGFEEICLIRNNADLEKFREQYGIVGDIEKIY